MDKVQKPSDSEILYRLDGLTEDRILQSLFICIIEQCMQCMYNTNFLLFW
jgi:hypothetical protein